MSPLKEWALALLTGFWIAALLILGWLGLQ